MPLILLCILKGKFISTHAHACRRREGRIERIVDDDTNLRRHVDFTSLLHIATRIYALLNCNEPPIYSGADKSLDRPGMKQATATEDFEFHISYL